MSAREHAHKLIDRLPDMQVTALAGLLEAMIDPASSAIAEAPAAAPADDEPVTEEDRRRFREGQARFAQRGKGIPMEEVLAEFGLKPEDFPLNK